MAHVSLVTLGVSDLGRSRRFYEGLGWRPAIAQEEVVFLEGGTVVLALFGREDLAADAGLPADEPGAFRGVAVATNLPSEAEVDATMARAESLGGVVVKPAERADWGGYSGYVTDPDGHLWEVAHNPLFPLDDQGRVTLPDPRE